MKKTKRRVFFITLLTIGLYVLTYLPLSSKGGWVVTESGNHRILLAVADEFKWQPRFGYLHRRRTIHGDHEIDGDVLGYFYAPLILIDQKWFHSTIPFIVDGEHVDPLPAPPHEDYHPTRVNRSYGQFPYEKGSENGDPIQGPQH